MGASVTSSSEVVLSVSRRPAAVRCEQQVTTGIVLCFVAIPMAELCTLSKECYFTWQYIARLHFDISNFRHPPICEGRTIERKMFTYTTHSCRTDEEVINLTMEECLLKS